MSLFMPGRRCYVVTSAHVTCTSGCEIDWRESNRQRQKDFSTNGHGVPVDMSYANSCMHACKGMSWNTRVIEEFRSSRSSSSSYCSNTILSKSIEVECKVTLLIWVHDSASAAASQSWWHGEYQCRMLIWMPVVECQSSVTVHLIGSWSCRSMKI